MNETIDLSDDDSSTNGDDVTGTQPEVPLPVLESTSTRTEEIPENSSARNLNSCFVGMGFSAALVDKVIEENGTKDPYALLEAIFTYSEVDGCDRVNFDKRKSLLKMDFSMEDINLAIDRLGEDASITDLVDFIFAAQTAGNLEENERDESPYNNIAQEEVTVSSVITQEALFGTVDKTVCLLDMGFSESEISEAIEHFGSDTPISELADSIFAAQLANGHAEENQDSLSYQWDSCVSGLKRAKHELPQADEICPHEVGENASETYGSKGQDNWTQIKLTGCAHGYDDIPKPFPHSKQFKCESLYFFYGTVMDIANENWAQISNFLYGMEPEFVNTQFFSAFARKEGYIHNLPTTGRSYILPKPPMTIEDSLPLTRKWWPSWDPRKQLSFMAVHSAGSIQICERIGKMLLDSEGLVSKEQQMDILHQCKNNNLIWVGKYKLSPVEPDQLERILGYPVNHTQLWSCGARERLRLLRNSFQTDTLGYHLSVLKVIFPQGLRVLSVFPGSGGVEVALHRLGIPLRVLACIEPSQWNQEIIKNWWKESGQQGTLVVLDNVEVVRIKKLESFIRMFGGFDLVVGGNPCDSDMDCPAGVNFPLFFEFVRVLDALKRLMRKAS